MNRRLAAILAADMVGYSRLMAADEAGTIARQKAHRAALIDPRIAQFRGRIVKTTGDGMLVEFPSAVDAVQCAVEIQRAMPERESSLPDAQRIRYRIGINLGDIVIDGDDILGDGVNVAARLESLSEPGGVCLSDVVYQNVQGRLDLRFDDLGEQALKNMQRQVRAWKWRSQSPPVAEPLPAAASLPLPDKPAIAILPFTNMSGDPEQEYFSDGITEDIITELSRFKNLLVIARNSSFRFKGRAVDVKEVERRLGAHYLVEGSVRKAGNRVRVTAQLIDAAEDKHIWAERYDRDLEDIFAVQDEVVRAIAGAIPGHLNRLAVEQLRRKTPGNLTAYDCELRGRWALTHWNEGLGEALKWFHKAVEADPNYALAHAGIAMAYSYGLYVLGLPPESALTHSKQHAQRAIVLDDRNPTVNAYAAFTYHVSGEPRLALTQSERAVSLNPNDPFALYVRACALCYGGELEQALDWFAKSERLEPYAPDDQRLDTLCDCYYMLGNYDKVIEIHDMYQHAPAFLYMVLAAACAQAGQLEKAAAAVDQYERTRPPGHDATTMIKFHVRMCARQRDRDLWLEGYRKAGFQV
jgi:adenylate cyclase